MKEFLKYTLANVVGIVIVIAIMGLISVVSIVGMIASSKSTAELKSNSVLVVDLNGTLSERSNPDIIAQLRGQSTGSIGLDEVLSAISKAKENENIKGIYIEAGMFLPDSPASTQAIRNQLSDFKKSGKWIVAYSDAYTQSAYYICSVADKLFVNPQGMIDWSGLGGTTMYLKDALAKFGVKMQVSKVGKYKSMPEMFTADKMSDPEREQVMAYINGIWNVMKTDVSASRKVSKETLNDLADSLITLSDPKDYVKYKMVDKLLYADEAREEVKKLLGIGVDEKIRQVSVNDMQSQPTPTKGEEIAVYYAYGDIVDQTPSSYSNKSYIAADKVCKDLEQLNDDDKVKAIVLRVNSGGGSAYASEQIWHIVKKIKTRKPIVVSMGGMAASGGYYISCAANYIMAEPTTLTGSIGIFGIFPDFSGLLTDKLGVKFDEAKTNKHGAFGTMARPFNAEEMRIINGYIARGYDLFLSRVAEGRHMSVAQVNDIAQGRVWLGQDAKKVKLVDGFGGLKEAVDKAAQLAKVEEYHAEAYPQLPGWADQIMKSFTGGGNYLDEQMQQMLGEYYSPFMFIKTINQQNAIQARMPFYIVTK